MIKPLKNIPHQEFQKKHPQIILDCQELFLAFSNTYEEYFKESSKNFEEMETSQFELACLKSPPIKIRFLNGLVALLEKDSPGEAFKRKLIFKIKHKFNIFKTEYEIVEKVKILENLTDQRTSLKVSIVNFRDQIVEKLSDILILKRRDLKTKKAFEILGGKEGFKKIPVLKIEFEKLESYPYHPMAITFPSSDIAQVKSCLTDAEMTCNIMKMKGMDGVDYLAFKIDIYRTDNTRSFNRKDDTFEEFGNLEDEQNLQDISIFAPYGTKILDSKRKPDEAYVITVPSHSLGCVLPLIEHSRMKFVGRSETDLITLSGVKLSDPNCKIDPKRHFCIEQDLVSNGSN